MLTFLAAAMMQPVAAPAAPAVDPDLRCMAAYLFAVGQMTDDPDVSEADKAGATAIVMYFFGKVRGRLPKADVKGDIKRLVETEGYLDNQLEPDLERCGKEYGLRGDELKAFGD